jgi:putative tryptophan/tyrosine transport system substrate-binding protein
MPRRILVLLVTLALGLYATPLAADAPPAAKVPRIGVLIPAEPRSPPSPTVAAFRQGLSDLGYVEGQTVAVEYRYAHGQVDRYAELAAQLVHLEVDVIVVPTGTATRAVKSVTSTIPIVMVGAGDPVGYGLVASLARPGGNVTGSSMQPGMELLGKQVELLKDAAPAISRVGFLYDARNPFRARYLHEVQSATQALGLQLHDLGLHEFHALDGVLAAMGAEPGGALLVSPSVPFLFPHRRQAAELVAKHQLPAIYGVRDWVDAGGLMSYGPSYPDLWRRATVYVDKILKGAKPADLPVEQPMTFELVINLKTAQALGLTVPPTLLFQATEVIR